MVWTSSVPSPPAGLKATRSHAFAVPAGTASAIRSRGTVIRCQYSTRALICWSPFHTPNRLPIRSGASAGARRCTTPDSPAPRFRRAARGHRQRKIAQRQRVVAASVLQRRLHGTISRARVGDRLQFHLLGDVAGREQPRGDRPERHVRQDLPHHVASAARPILQGQPAPPPPPPARSPPCRRAENGAAPCSRAVRRAAFCAGSCCTGARTRRARSSPTARRSPR